MIPNTIAELARALVTELGIDFDAGVAMAWRISRALDAAGVTLEDKPQ